jgi:hypothetical protein
MSKWSFGNSNWTPATTADAAAHANASYQCLKGANTTQILEVKEIYMAGMVAATSSPMFMMMARASTLGITPTALAAPAHDGPLHPSATPPTGNVPVSYTAAATGPQRSNATTSARLEIGINAWGGIVRWTPSDREDWVSVGNAVNGGESILSSLGGTAGAIVSHIVYEPL